jgi:hypothetical protein
MSKYFNIRLKDLETVIYENAINFENSERIEFKDGTVIILQMFENFGKIMEVTENVWDPYHYRDTEGKYMYSDKWVLNEDPAISKLFDELLEEL